VIRVVVTVLLAVAIVAAAMPVVDHEAADRSDATLRAEIEAIDLAATTLLRSEESVPGTVGARRSLAVELPASGIAAAGVDHLTISPANRSYRYRVAGRIPRTVQGRTRVYTHDGEPLVLEASGTHELVLALVEFEEERRVVVARRRAVESGALGGATG